jgi:hypothetical protein
MKARESQNQPATPAVSPRLDEVMDRIGPDFVFVDPQQAPLYHPRSLESGESRLALAILEDALRCAIRHSDSPIPRQREEAQEAMEWIESTECIYSLAFEPICQRFGLDPDWIRAQVKRIVSATPDASNQPRAA